MGMCMSCATAETPYDTNGATLRHKSAAESQVFAADAKARWQPAEAPAKAEPVALNTPPKPRARVPESTPAKAEAKAAELPVEMATPEPDRSKTPGGNLPRISHNSNYAL